MPTPKGKTALCRIIWSKRSPLPTIDSSWAEKREGDAMRRHGMMCRALAAALVAVMAASVTYTAAGAETPLCPRHMVMTRDGCQSSGHAYAPNAPVQRSTSPDATKDNGSEAERQGRATKPAVRPELDVSKPIFVAKGRVLCIDTAVVDAFLDGQLKGGERAGNEAILDLFLFPKRTGCIRTMERERVYLGEEPVSPGKLVKVRYSSSTWYALPTDVEN
jgi:hypothetical protein